MTTPQPEPFTAVLERMNRFQEPEARAIIDDLGLAPGSRGLDVGCGVGLYALWLAEAVGPRGRVIGVEPTAERVEAARALVGSGSGSRAELEFRVGDGTALDLPAGGLDWVWCGDVLHHIPDTQGALKEMARVLRPGGLLVIKESQALPAMFLPGHPELEKRIQLAEIARGREEAGERSFQERRQRTPESLRAAGLGEIAGRTYMLSRRAPLDGAARDYIQRVVFDRNWGPRLDALLDPADRALRSALCDAGAPGAALASPDYYCLYPISVFTARTPA
jgi:demethylmenaquinone methyltransferase/2-methoxy-6-polyprenyl-1,4-benzoquinol methylase